MREFLKSTQNPEKTLEIRTKFRNSRQKRTFEECLKRNLELYAEKSHEKRKNATVKLGKNEA